MEIHSTQWRIEKRKKRKKQLRRETSNKRKLLKTRAVASARARLFQKFIITVRVHVRCPYTTRVWHISCTIRPFKRKLWLARFAHCLVRATHICLFVQNRAQMWTPIEMHFNFWVSEWVQWVQWVCECVSLFPPNTKNTYSYNNYYENFNCRFRTTTWKRPPSLNDSHRANKERTHNTS